MTTPHSRCSHEPRRDGFPQRAQGFRLVNRRGRGRRLHRRTSMEASRRYLVSPAPSRLHDHAGNESRAGHSYSPTPRRASVMSTLYITEYGQCSKDGALIEPAITTQAVTFTTASVQSA